MRNTLKIALITIDVIWQSICAAAFLAAVYFVYTLPYSSMTLMEAFQILTK